MFADDAGICSEKRKQMEDSMGKCYGEKMKAEVRQCWQGGVGGRVSGLICKGKVYIMLVRLCDV